MINTPPSVGLIESRKLAVERCQPARYPDIPPFHPSEHYPEYPFGTKGVAQQPNPVYDAVRRALRDLGLDVFNYGTDKWNPLGVVIRPGNKVVIKPNWVFHSNLGVDSGDPTAVITHSSVVRALVDYAYIATGDEGEIVLADVPLVSAKFDSILESTRVESIPDWYKTERSFDLAIFDLRPFAALSIRGNIFARKTKLSGDPQGYVEVDLGTESALEGLDNLHRARVDSYDVAEMIENHRQGRHSYKIPRTMLEADVFINVPKLKTHCKAGITVALKNIIGINASKSHLPHYRLGSPESGGDEYPKADALKRVQSLARGYAPSIPFLFNLGKHALETVLQIRRMVHNDANVAGYNAKGGAWSGNDTLWRTIVDVNHILFCADKDGLMRPEPQRAYLCVVDGVIGGEGNGPISPQPIEAGLVIAGWNPVAVDMLSCVIMGFDHHLLKHITGAQRLKFFNSEGCQLNDLEIAGDFHTVTDLWAFPRPFKPAPHWETLVTSAQEQVFAE